MMEQSLVELNNKIDLLSAQVAKLSELALANERQRQQRAELVNDLTPIANQAFHMAIEQLEEVQEYIDLSDLLHFLKRLLRNGRNFSKLLDQLESLMDLIDTMGPLANEAFGKAIDMMSTLEHKGYFSLAHHGAQTIDNVLTSLNEEDIQNAGDNAMVILDMIREINHPEIFETARESLLVAKQELEKPVDNSISGLIRQMRDPEVRRGLAITLLILKVIGTQVSHKKVLEN